MIYLATLITLISVYLIQERGVFTQSKVKHVGSIILMIAAGILLSVEYGTLRGVFIFLGLLSLVGTVFTLLRYKLTAEN